MVWPEIVRNPPIPGMALLLLLGQMACGPTSGVQTPTKEAQGSAACDGGTPQRWDLGTGRLEDISVREPGFYSFDNPGAPTNQERRVRLHRATLPVGVILNQQQVEGFPFAELRARVDAAEERVFLFSTKERGYGILLAPASCPHVFAEESCVDKRLVTSVTTDGRLPCFKGVSGKLSISADGLSGNAEVTPGEVVWIEKADTKGLTVTLSFGGRVLFNEPVPLDRYAKTTPAILFGLLQYGDDLGAFRAYMTLDQRWAKSALADEVERIRLLRLQGRLKSEEDVLEIYETMWFDERFPGHEKVLRLIDDELARSFNALVTSAPSRGRFLHGTSILDRSEDQKRLDVDGFVAQYGAFFVNGQVDGSPAEVSSAEKEFIQRWPEDVATKQLLAGKKKEAAETQAKDDAERKEQAAAEKREEAEERERCSARCTHKCMHPKFANKSLCHQGCLNVECEENECVGFCQADCATTAKAGQPGCVSACVKGRCGG